MAGKPKGKRRDGDAALFSIWLLDRLLIRPQGRSPGRRRLRRHQARSSGTPGALKGERPRSTLRIKNTGTEEWYLETEPYVSSPTICSMKRRDSPEVSTTRGLRFPGCSVRAGDRRRVSASRRPWSRENTASNSTSSAKAWPGSRTSGRSLLCGNRLRVEERRSALGQTNYRVEHPRVRGAPEAHPPHARNRRGRIPGQDRKGQRVRRRRRLPSDLAPRRRHHHPGFPLFLSRSLPFILARRAPGLPERRRRPRRLGRLRGPVGQEHGRDRPGSERRPGRLRLFRAHGQGMAG